MQIIGKTISTKSKSFAQQIITLMQLVNAVTIVQQIVKKRLEKAVSGRRCNWRIGDAISLYTKNIQLCLHTQNHLSESMFRLKDNFKKTKNKSS